jgi:hypothetical protein
MTQTVLIPQHSRDLLIVDTSDWVHPEPPPGAPSLQRMWGVHAGLREIPWRAAWRILKLKLLVRTSVRTKADRRRPRGMRSAANIEHHVGAVRDHSIGPFPPSLPLLSNRGRTYE